MTDFTDGFRHHIPITVRFHDLDALGHVNNARYLNYLEQGRLAYARDVWDWDGRMQTLGLIVATVTVDFKAPVHLGDTLTLYTRITRLGNKSFDMHYRLGVITREATQPQLAADAKVTLVVYDYQQGQTVPIADDVRAAVGAYEPALDG